MINSFALITIIFQLLTFYEAIAWNLWPQPSTVSVDNQVYSIDPNSFSFKLSNSTSSNDIILQAFERYRKLIFDSHPQYDQILRRSFQRSHVNRMESSISEPHNTTSQLKELIISYNNPTIDLQFGIDESYSLMVQAPQVNIVSNNVFGALHGLETFSQLVEYDSNTKWYSISLCPIQIQDKPRFPHRGLLIDTSRHFLEVSTILRTIDALSYNKMNVLHWHAIDAESFPIYCTKFPNLALAGAWNPNLIYGSADIAKIVQYGLYRGVRVIPEFDTPGHSYSWGLGMPGITATCPGYASNINNIPLNPSNESTYTVLSGFLTEMKNAFIDKFIHIGGDEVIYGCWKQDPNITTWMAQNNMNSYDQVMQYYENRLWQIIREGERPKQMIAWEEIFTSYSLKLPSDIVIEVWKDEKILLSVAQSNFLGILAYGWYLDHLEETWVDFYNNEPFESSDWNDQLKKFIIGGESAAWGEQLDSQNYDAIVWPRTCATAERLWSSEVVNDSNIAKPRLIGHICRLNQRGIESGPIQPGYCPF